MDRLETSAEIAERLIETIEDGMGKKKPIDVLLEAAQVHATLAVAAELKALRELLSNADGTHAYVAADANVVAG